MDILKDYDEIVYIPLSSGLSSTYQIPLLSSSAFDGSVCVADAKFACDPIKVLIQYVKKMIEKECMLKKLSKR